MPATSPRFSDCGPTSGPTGPSVGTGAGRDGAVDRLLAAARNQPVRRSRDDRWVAGVAAGVARWLRIDPVIVRVGVVCLTFLFGAGVSLYLVAWVLLPVQSDGTVGGQGDGHGDGHGDGRAAGQGAERIVFEDAVRGRRPGAIALCVAAAIGAVAAAVPIQGSPGGLGPVLLVLAAWFLWRRHASRRAAPPTPSGGGPQDDLGAGQRGAGSGNR